MKEETSLIPFQQQADVQISKDDMIAITVAQREQALRLATQETEELLISLNEKTQKLSRDLGADISSYKKHGLKRAKKLNDVFKENGLPFKAAICVSPRHPRLDKDEQDPFETPDVEKLINVVVITIQVLLDTNSKNLSHHGYNLEITNGKPQVVPFTAKTRKLLAEQQQNRKHIQMCQSRLAEIRKALSEISSLERLARAEIAARVLNESEKGREMLRKLKSVDMTSLTKIPELLAPKI